MGVITGLTSLLQVWMWGPTQQRAFEAIKDGVNKHRDHHCVMIKYRPNEPPINMVADASLTGTGGIVSQGEDPHKAKVIAFWSRKFNSAQQNYPVHE